MPRGDRTGPDGAGPQTGRAMGYCAGFNMPGYANRPGGQGLGMGYGRGGRGRGRGFGRGFMGPNVVPQGQNIPPQQELNNLRQQADILQNQLNQITERIEELDKES